MAISKITSAGVDPNSIATNGTNGAIDVNASAPADSLAIGSTGTVTQNIPSASDYTIYKTNGSTKGVLGDESGNFIVKSASALLLQTNGSERMRIDSSGNLLVGTTGLTSNGTRLTLSGSERVARIYGTTEGTAPVTIDKSSATTTTSQVYIQFSVNNQGSGCGQINANGASQAAFGSFSDQRLKENIVDLPPQLDNICALRPVEFDYIQSEGGGHQIGFVAQEMQEIYPDSIGVRQPDEMLTVTGWSKTEARLVKAIQELKAENDALKSRLDAVEALEARIAALEAA